MFNVKFRDYLLMVPGLYEELDAFYKNLSAFLLVSHNDDGTSSLETTGQWEPTLGGATSTVGQVYAARTGSYVKSGLWVNAGFRVTLTAKGTITGGVQIQGLPFTAADVDSPGVLVMGNHTNLATAVVDFSGRVGRLSRVVTLHIKTAAAVTDSDLAAANVADNTEIFGNVIYQAES